MPRPFRHWRVNGSIATTLRILSAAMCPCRSRLRWMERSAKSGHEPLRVACEIEKRLGDFRVGQDQELLVFHGLDDQSGRVIRFEDHPPEALLRVLVGHIGHHGRYDRPRTGAGNLDAARAVFKVERLRETERRMLGGGMSGRGRAGGERDGRGGRGDIPSARCQPYAAARISRHGHAP